MKAVTIRFWVPEDTDTSTIDGYRNDLAPVAAWVAALDPKTANEPITDKKFAEIAGGMAEREYRDTVNGIVEDLKSACADGEITDRDGAQDWLHQTIDGHHDVIYTYAAQNVILQSRNDGAYFEQFGDDGGAVKDGAINWSLLAYCALEADVLEAIGDLDEWFKCSECGGDVTPEDIKTAGESLPTCEDCRNDGKDEDEDEGAEAGE